MVGDDSSKDNHLFKQGADWLEQKLDKTGQHPYV
jgi:hypothetical protein